MPKPPTPGHVLQRKHLPLVLNLPLRCELHEVGVASPSPGVVYFVTRKGPTLRQGRHRESQLLDGSRFEQRSRELQDLWFLSVFKPEAFICGRD